jgi:hypothetical protein
MATIEPTPQSDLFAPYTPLELGARQARMDAVSHQDECSTGRLFSGSCQQGGMSRVPQNGDPPHVLVLMGRGDAQRCS